MKKMFALLLALATMFAMVSCGGGEGGGSSDKLTFTTGGETGTYYAFGGVIAQSVSSNTSTSVTAVSSDGSKANVLLLAAGDAQLGFCQSDVMDYAYNGTSTFADVGAVKDFSTVANLYLEQVQIVTCDPSIKSVADLKGKKVSVGAAGSGVYFNAMDVLGVYGMTEDDIVANYQGFGESADSLTDGTIDAAFVVAGAPTNNVVSLATSKDVYLVSLDDAHIDQLIAKSPYYTKVTIPADVYGLDSDTTTVAVGAVVIARDDVSEDAVYNFVSTLFGNKDSLAHGKAAELDLAVASSVTAVPYHPGAAKFFSEQGITVPVK